MGFAAAAAAALLASAFGTASGCGSGEETLVPGQGASGGAGGTTATGGAGTGGLILTGGGGSGTGGGTSTCSPPCTAAQVCSHGVCVPLVPCTGNEDCQNDTYCDPAHGCLPWGDPTHDEGCIQVIPPGVLAPRVQCELSVAPPNDPFPNHVDVQSTPMVVNVHKPMDSGPPSILASFTATVPGGYTEDLGVIRVLSGQDCSVEAVLGGTDLDNDGQPEWTVSCSSLATGDLDGDGVAEIVAYGADGSTYAFTYKLVNWVHQWSLLWAAPYPGGAPWAPCDVNAHYCSLGWAGPSIHDVNDDGAAEVIREGVVFSSTGQLLSLQPAGYASYSVGLFPTLAKLDDDAFVEFTNGQLIWHWESGAWVQESYFTGSTPGLVAIADFGAYGSGAPETPEIAVVRGGTATVYALDGTVVQHIAALPGAGTGGPPTVSDFDGDGLVELAVASRGAYSVFDIDCTASPRAGGSCPAGVCDYLAGPCAAGSGVAWSRASQDFSSSVTGSSIFDFEADGNAEAIYADECFVRVYQGTTGEVLFSQYRSSCTWHENPLVADVDGDFRAELVTPSNKACSTGGLGVTCTMLNGDGVDPLFNGVRCQIGADCESLQCDQGLCRCTATAQCCAANDDALCLQQGLKCSPPNPGTPGAGNTCRAPHPNGVSGIRVYGDANDQWVKSRQIWNQHAYHVTHVNEDGTVPATVDWQRNWQQPGLNNFRQNVPGEPNGNAIGDATAGASSLYGCDGSNAVLYVDVCNRGATALPPGIAVGFYVGGQPVCQAQTSGAIEPGACQTVSCSWSDPPGSVGEAVDVSVVADDGGNVTECEEANNQGTILGVYCQPPV
jgi:hypothetical protein